MLTRILSLLFPPQCYLCRGKETLLCSSCLLARQRSLETPSIYIHAAYSFKDKGIKKIIHGIKYYKRKDLIDPLITHIHQRGLFSHLISPSKITPILVPIPMSPFRKYMRGYNQAERIAHSFGKIWNIPVATDILIRKNIHKRQVTTHSKKERLTNQRGAFEVMKSIHGKTILLVDDVTTTGATFDEARKALLAHGASKVTAIALAH